MHPLFFLGPTPRTCQLPCWPRLLSSLSIEKDRRRSRWLLFPGPKYKSVLANMSPSFSLKSLLILSLPSGTWSDKQVAANVIHSPSSIQRTSSTLHSFFAPDGPTRKLPASSSSFPHAEKGAVLLLSPAGLCPDRQRLANFFPSTR